MRSLKKEAQQRLVCYLYEARHPLLAHQGKKCQHPPSIQSEANASPESEDDCFQHIPKFNLSSCKLPSSTTFVRPRFMKQLFLFEEVLAAPSQFDPDELLDFICYQFI